MPVPGRERKVDLKSMPVEHQENLGAQLMEKIQEITRRAVAEANEILGIYGIKAHMQMAWEEINPSPEPQTTELPPPKKSRKPRAPRKAKQS